MPKQELSGRVAVAGVGTTRYGKLPEYDAYDLGVWALKEALADCGLGFDAIDGLIVNRIPDYQRFGEITGLDPRYTNTTPGQGRFSGICIQTAVAVIAAGMAETVALVYGNNGRSAGDHYGGASDAYGSGGAGLWFPYGMTSPGAFHALMMRRHMEQYGTTAAQLGAVAMAFRKHASLNPDAVMRTPFTIEDYLAARFICEPLRLLDYCLINDGGVAMMIYDNFTPTVLFSLEGFGFCPVGESGPWVADGKLQLGGAFPTNTSGGHLSESYMQGWALNVE